MPDLSILVELADFYDVDIRDIIDGERKGEDMNKEEKERLQLVADYAETEKNTLLMRLRIFSIVGLVSLIAGLVMLVLGGDNNLPLPAQDSRQCVCRTDFICWMPRLDILARTSTI